MNSDRLRCFLRVSHALCSLRSLIRHGQFWLAAFILTGLAMAESGESLAAAPESSSSSEGAPASVLDAEEVAPQSVQRLAELHQLGQKYFTIRNEETIINPSIRIPLSYPLFFTDLATSPTFVKEHPSVEYTNNHLSNIISTLLPRTINRQGIIDFFENQDIRYHLVFRKSQIATLLGRMVGARPERFWSYQLIRYWFKSAAQLAQNNPDGLSLPGGLTESLPDFAFYQAVAAFAASAEFARGTVGRNLPALDILAQEITPYLDHPDITLRFMALASLATVKAAQGQKCDVLKYLNDPTWFTLAIDSQASRIHFFLRMYFLYPLIDGLLAVDASSPAVASATKAIYDLAKRCLIARPETLEFRLFEGEVTGLTARSALTLAGINAFYQEARQQVARSTDEDYYNLAVRVTLLPYFDRQNSREQQQRAADAQELLKAPFAEDQIMVAASLIRHDFWPSPEVRAQFEDISWWKNLFEQISTKVGTGLFVQKVMRGIRENHVHHFDHLAVPLMVVHLKSLAENALKHHDYTAIDEAVYNVGSLFSRQRPLSFLAQLIERLFQWDGQLAGLPHTPEDTALNISLAQLLAFSMMENIGKREARQEIFARFAQELWPREGRDPFVQLMGVITMLYDPDPKALASMQFILRNEKNVQIFFQGDSWWPARVRYELFLRRHTFYIKRTLPYYNRQVPPTEEQKRASGTYLKQFYDEDHLDLSQEEDLRLAQNVIRTIAQTSILYLKTEIKARGTPSLPEQIRLTNFISVLVGRYAHYEEAISMILDYLLNYHPATTLSEKDQDSELFIATALGAMLCDYYTHVKTQQFNLFLNSLERFLKHPRPAIRLIGIFLATQNGDLRGINQEFFAMMADPAWIKDYLRPDRDRDFPLLERLLVLKSRLFFLELEASIDTLKSNKKLKSTVNHPFIALRPYQILELLRLNPAFSFGQTPSIEVLNREVPQRLEALDFGRFPEDLAWLYLQDEPWFGQAKNQQLALNYLAQLFTYLINTAQNDELDVVKLNYTNSERRLRSYLAANLALVVVSFPSFFVEKFCQHLITLVEQMPDRPEQEAYISAIIHMLSHVADAERILTTPDIQNFLGRLLNGHDSNYQSLALAAHLAAPHESLNRVALEIMNDDAWLKQFMDLNSSALSLSSRWANIINGLTVTDREVFTTMLLVALQLRLEPEAMLVPLGQETSLAPPPTLAKHSYTLDKCRTSFLP